MTSSASTTSATLVIDALSVSRGTHRVIDACTMTLPVGQVHAIVGHNGAGKTTLFEALFGFVTPTAGAVTLSGRPLRSSDVAYLPTSLELYAGLSGAETLALFGQGHVTPAMQRQAEALDVPLHDVIDSYSYGTRRKLALVGVMSLQRPVLLLDEPFEALDVISRRVLRHLLRQAAVRGQAVVFSAHELESLESFCDTISVLQGGAVLAQFPAQSMAAIEEQLSREVDRRLRHVASRSDRPDA